MKARRKMISRLVLATLLASAGAAPVAASMPVDDTAFYSSKAYAPSAAQMDMHASTVKPPAAASQDLRTEASMAPSRATVRASVVKPDLRTEGAIAPSRAVAHASVVKSDFRTEAAAAPSRAPVGMPTWPVNPKPIAPPAPQPVAADGDGGGFEWPIAVLALGALVLGGGVMIAGHRLRAQARPAS